MSPAQWRPLALAGVTPIPRAFHALAAVPSGDGDGVPAVYMWGGMAADEAGNNVLMNDLVAFEVNPADQSVVVKHIQQTGELPCAREGHSLVYMPGEPSGLLVLFGGSDIDGNELSDFFIFQLTSRRWKKMQGKGKVPGPRLNHAAVMVGTELFVHGGFHNGAALEDMYALSFGSMTWRQVSAPLSPPARCGHSMVATADKLVVFGGRCGEEQLFQDVWIYSLAKKTWTAAKTTDIAPVERDFHAAVLTSSGKRMIVFGGAQEIESRDIFEYFSATHALDLDSLAWTTLNPNGDVPSPRLGHKLCPLGNETYFLFGGTANDVDLNDCFLLLLPSDEPAATEAAGGAEATSKGSAGAAKEKDKDKEKKKGLFRLRTGTSGASSKKKRAAPPPPMSISGPAVTASATQELLAGGKPAAATETPRKPKTVEPTKAAPSKARVAPPPTEQAATEAAKPVPARPGSGPGPAPPLDTTDLEAHLQSSIGAVLKALQAEHAQLAAEREQLAVERAALAEERAALQSSGLDQNDRNALDEERAALEALRASVEQEKRELGTKRARLEALIDQFRAL